MYHSTAHFYEFFDKAAADNEAKSRVQFLEPFLAKTDSILEIGSGTGTTAMAFADLGKSVTCLEPSEDMRSVFLTKLNGKLGLIDRLTLLPYSATDFEVAKSWPLICSFIVFFLLTKNEEREQGFRRIADHLELGGTFVFNALNFRAARLDKELS